MNSIGFAPSRSVMPNSTMRASGYHAAMNTAIFAGTIQRAPLAGRFAVAAAFALLPLLRAAR